MQRLGSKMSRTVVSPLMSAPNKAETLNHRLLVQGGFVRQLMAGVYSYLPLGLRVLKKIENIVREEMDSLGAEEILMPILHPASIWKKTGGWDSIDVLFKLKSRTDKDYALGQSQEEVVTPLVGEFVRSYKDLPLAVYHIQWKFRDELRSKSGILRGREFLMKDMYSWHKTQDDFDNFYSKTKEAYLRVYKKLGLVAKVTEASGGEFSDKTSYEFMVLTEAGEDDILYCPSCEFCVNTEIAKISEREGCPSCKKTRLQKAKASEVGNVFDLGDKYVRDFEISYTDKNGESKFPVMGCYGIGISRSMGVVVEKNADDRGIIWPESIAPYKVHLISLNGEEGKAEGLYKKLISIGVEVLWDDRDKSAGAKFADCDLIGNPYRVVISGRSLTEGGVELKKRNSARVVMLDMDELINKMRS